MFLFSNNFYQNLDELQREEIKVLQALWETFYQSSFIEVKSNFNDSLMVFLFKDKEENLVFYAQEILINGKKSLSFCWHPKVERELSCFFNEILSLFPKKSCFCLNDSFPFFVFEELKNLSFQELRKEDVFIFSSKLKFVRDQESLVFYEEVSSDKLFLDVLKEGIKIASIEYEDKEGFNFFFDLNFQDSNSLSLEEAVHIVSKSLSLIREKGFKKDIIVLLDKDIFFIDVLLSSGFRNAKSISFWSLDY